MKLYNYLCDKWSLYLENRNYFKLVLLILMIVVGAGGAFLILYTAAYFIALNYEAIILVGLAVGLIKYSLDEKRKEQQKKDKVLKEEQYRETSERDKAVADRNWQFVQPAIFTVISEMADVLKVVKPQLMSEILSPVKYFTQNGVTVYQFHCLKVQESDVNFIQEVVQRRIVQKLQCNEFSGLSQATYVYEGDTYPLLFIDKVINYPTFIEINAVIVNQEYCRQLKLNERIRYEAKNGIVQDIRDRDF